MADGNTTAAFVESPHFTNAYAKRFLQFERGRGCRLWDTAGRSYLDFGSGISVNALGHGRKDLAKIASRQMRRLIHVSNLYTTRPAVELAKRLIGLGDFAAVHYGNSGSESVEGAIKFARLYGKRTANDKKIKLLCFENAFHGRTMGALSVTPTAKYQDPFGPLIPGVTVGRLNDLTSLQVLDSGEYCGVIVEPVQGEGGLESVSEEFAKALNESCRRNDVLLLADEVQTGLGRCGYALASVAVGISPDIVTLSKPLAAGLPLSATLIPERVNRLISTGEHGTTFGGGPVTTAVALHVVQTLLSKKFLQSVAERAATLEARLREMVLEMELVQEMRGLGLLRGLVVAESHADRVPDVISRAEDAGLLILRSGSRAIRLAPPLIISDKEISEGTRILSTIMKSVLNK